MEMSHGKGVSYVMTCYSVNKFLSLRMASKSIEREYTVQYRSCAIAWPGFCRITNKLWCTQKRLAPLSHSIPTPSPPLIFTSAVAKFMDLLQES
jgi:hypothetical protein